MASQGFIVDGKYYEDWNAYIMENNSEEETEMAVGDAPNEVESDFSVGEDEVTDHNTVPKPFAKSMQKSKLCVKDVNEPNEVQSEVSIYKSASCSTPVRFLLIF